MKLNNIKKQAGLTLIEVTLVIAVLLGLISVLFIGVSAYKEGSNRAKCILNITNVQKAVRSFQNMYEKELGTPLVQATLVGAGKMLETAPTCPSGATYAWAGTIVPIGTAYLTCNYTGGGAEAVHAPSSLSGW